ncbi:sulfite exporter TauE/SafE family protein [Nocardioides ferulae]|uniref:sulfite exporter TauE/SafE family protein n=1 Tax=Nocardioides ferulae TaxID=2340821 RepID=UPI000EAE2DD5|nr:sulfite exporter TauE/SafE family protein [Nocardioides ferulae]
MSDPWLWVAGFVLVAYTVEAVTGFGSIVIAVSLGALVLPVADLLPVLVPLNVLMTSFLVTRHRRHVDRPTLVRRILPLMLAGMLVGYLAAPHLPAGSLRMVLGALVLWFALRELGRWLRRVEPRRHGPWLTRSLIVGAGVSHGLVASGGPLLVAGLAGTTLGKAALRATLLTVWLLLNTTLTVLFALAGSLLPALPRVLALTPVLVVGLVAGEVLHRRLDEQVFRRVVHLLLAGTGVALLVGG